MTEPKRKYFNLPNRREDLPFSDAFWLVTRCIFPVGSGSIRRPDTRQQDIEQEISFLLDGIKAVLEQAGMSMDDLVYVQIFCPDLSLFEHFNRRYRSYFRGRSSGASVYWVGPTASQRAVRDHGAGTEAVGDAFCGCNEGRSGREL